MKYFVRFSIGFRDLSGNIYDISSSPIMVTLPCDDGSIVSDILYFDYSEDAISFIHRKFGAESIDDPDVLVSDIRGIHHVDDGELQGHFVHEFVVVKEECDDLVA